MNPETWTDESGREWRQVGSDFQYYVPGHKGRIPSATYAGFWRSVSERPSKTAPENPSKKGR